MNKRLGRLRLSVYADKPHQSFAPINIIDHVEMRNPLQTGLSQEPISSAQIAAKNAKIRYKLSQSTSLAKRSSALEQELSSLPSADCPRCSELPLGLLAEQERARSALWEHLLALPQASKVMAPGRLVLVRQAGESKANLLGALSSMAPREKRLSLWALVDAKPSVKEHLPWPLSKKVLIPEGTLAVQQLTVPFADVLCIVSHTIKLDPKRLAHPQGKTLLGQELLEVVEAHPKDLPAINVTKDMRIQAMDSVDLVQRCQMLEEKLLSSDCLGCPLFETHFDQGRRRQRLTEELARMRHLLSEESLASMPDYQNHVLALEKLGYLEPEGALTLKGRVARALSSHEVMLTELLLQESLLTLGAPEVAALFSSFVFEQRTEDELAVHKFGEVARRIGKVQRECGFDEPPDQFVEQFSFGLCNVVYHWAKGMHFAHIMELTKTQEGIIVRCIQRLDELLKDVRTAAGIVGNPELRAKMEEASRLIRRDIVFAASLYLQ
ncbi:hypothetical protein HPB47_006581 [Ixodes persulcatus]|uniref:Uncharacterized protein n=1 Tax=Ixodes persulcatus TaxID=34615 RepID=A0AC60PAU3_IXOPE|nr:hypothetical protein HPB47_006581 [Ixodes persulcatus]